MGREARLGFGCRREVGGARRSRLGFRVERATPLELLVFELLLRLVGGQLRVVLQRRRQLVELGFGVERLPLLRGRCTDSRLRLDG